MPTPKSDNFNTYISPLYIEDNTYIAPALYFTEGH